MELWRSLKILRFFAHFSVGAARPRGKWMIWSLDLPQSTPAGAMELKFASVLEFRRVLISQKAPWLQPLLELHNGKGRRISFPYILMIFPLYLLNGSWILSRVEFGWFWVDFSWKIRENLAPGSFGFDVVFHNLGRCTRFWTQWKDTKNRRNRASRH